MSKNTGGPAFPHKVFMGARINYSTNLEEFVYSEQPGAITLRDYFAAKAMQASATNETGANGFTFEQRAEWAYLQADAMIKEREK